ncbi:MAG: DUF2254 domain-containing protein [Gammaproteobacteria bacterium]
MLLTKRFQLARLREQLWFRPLVACLVSIGAALVARLADDVQAPSHLPDISTESIKALLTTLSSSMLAISVFAVGSMISAYASASSSATPRSFSLVVGDDVSQNALSTFIGAFIFSIVALVALLNDFYGQTGRLVLFAFTVFVFVLVILGFVRWVDRIARLGRLGNTVEKVEAATEAALRLQVQLPRLGAPMPDAPEQGEAVTCEQVGYVQNVDFEEIQSIAESIDAQIIIRSMPGTLTTPNEPLALIRAAHLEDRDSVNEKIIHAFTIGKQRTFVSDPRFGLVVLSQIASRALSPGVNDPGTAIDIITSVTRLLIDWQRAADDKEDMEVEFDRVVIPDVSADELLDDAFSQLACDGAGTITVAIRHQKALNTLATLGDRSMKAAAKRHANLALEHALCSLKLESERQAIQSLVEKHFGTDSLTA